MSQLQTDEEQIETLKHIWKKYSTPVGLAALLVAGGMYGYNFFQKRAAEKAESASVLYQNLVDTYLPQDDKATSDELDYGTLDQIVKSLNTDHADSVYSEMAQLLQAKWYVEQGKNDQSAEVLRRLAGRAKMPEIKAVADLRLAQVLLAAGTQKAAMEALQVLDATPFLAGKFAISFHELKGDVLLALNRKSEARKSYQQALNGHVLRGSNQMLIQIKLDDLADAESGDAGI